MTTVLTSSLDDKTLARIGLQYEIEQFLYEEARMLDERRFKDWIDLFTDDIQYWMPIVSNRMGKDLGNERTLPGELAHFDEDKTSLANRARRLESGAAWAETPPSRTRHIVGNVQVQPLEQEDSVSVVSAFLLWRSHLEHDEEAFSGQRHDVLRRCSGGWRIAKRTIYLDHSVITQKSLGAFF